MAFLDYYRDNLAHIRSLAAEFAAEFPKVASRLELTENECQDPYVERLLEGAAFLAARVEKKIDDGLPRMMEAILGSIAPLALYPVPSYCVLELQPNMQDERLAKGYLLPAMSRFDCDIPGIGTKCTFSTLTGIKLYPLNLAALAYSTRDLEKYKFPVRNDGGQNVQAALYLKLERQDGGKISECLVDELPFYINMLEGEASLLQSQFIADFDGVYLYKDGVSTPLPDVTLEMPMFKDEQDGLTNVLHGLKTLQRFLAYPQMFKNILMRGLGKAFRASNGSSIELVVAFKRREPSFVHSLGVEQLRLWCVPAANIFHKNSDRSVFSGEFEQHVVPERTAPQNYEVYKILSVDAYNEKNELLFTCRRNFDVQSSMMDDHNYFVPHRQERMLSTTRPARSSYNGTEEFISFAGKDYSEKWSEICQFRAELLCTNRDLPLLIRHGSKLSAPDISAVISASFISSPSSPHNPVIARGSVNDWQKVGHIVFNLSSALWLEGKDPVTIIRDVVRSYGVGSEEETNNLANGILSITSRPRTFRFINNGCVYYENGWKTEITLDERAYEGTGHFLFATVLTEFLKSYSVLNTYLEITLNTDKRQGVMTWIV